MSSKLKRKILVLGCGALGGALIEYLGACADITIIDPSPRVRVEEHVFHDVDALKGSSFDGLIVATKCYDIDRALIQLKNHVFVRRILFLQNGLLNLAPAQKLFPQASIVRGVTTSAVGISSQKSVFYYKGVFFLAPKDNKKNEAISWFRRLLMDAGFETSSVLKSDRIVWAKLIFSAAMNPLPVITGQGYEVLRDAETWKLVRDAVEEGRRVAKVLRVRLAFDPLLLIDRVRKGDLVGIQHCGSMSQDLSVGRLTELDFITGALIRQARKLHIKTPALDVIFKKAKQAGA